ncbi:MAG: hypothetical protein ACRBDL_06490 [Alphaproteobacteria bacterium]
MSAEQQEAEILKQTIIEDEKPKSSLSDKLKDKKKKQRKKNIKKYSILSFVGLIAFGIWFLFIKPYEAGPRYGICRSFLELTVPYPHTIHVSELKKHRDGGILLWYTYVDGFGGYRMESFTCNVKQDPKTKKWELFKIKLHKVDMDPQKIEHLAHALTYFDANPVVMEYPRRLPDSLRGLRFKTDNFRRIKISDKKEY